MRNKLAQRLAMLKAELESGQKMMAELEAKEAKLRETLQRISGAIQALEDELAQSEKTCSFQHSSHKTDIPGKT